ncbi:MAG: SGNH/GDSL hydrolase family protein, partial [Nitrosopumilaceae archaeon]
MLVIVFFAVLEGILRIYDYYNPRCDFMSNPLSKDMDYEFKKQICDMWKNHIVYLDPTSGISQNVPNQHFLTVNINSHGFRGPEIFIEKPDDTYRIFVVGGSTTFSIRALSDQHTIPGYLQQKFDETGLDKKIEVINAGIDAVTSTDELQLVKSKIVNYKPDLIIIYDGHNDVVNFPGKIKNKF